MGRLAARIFAEWDKASLMAFALALALLVLMLGLAAFGPETTRQAALIAAGGLFFVAQGVFMWGNRGMVTPYKKAQDAFMQGDFARARAILEAERFRAKLDAESLTLLGNTYRQLGLLDESEAALRDALAIRPSHYFPLYGFGRTLLAKGEYAQAAAAVEKALDNGAPFVVKFDLADIRYRQGEYEEARLLFQDLHPKLQEPYRLLMAEYVLYQMGAGDLPNTQYLLDGLPYWLASAQRFSHTPYGQSLAVDVRSIQSLIEER